MPKFIKYTLINVLEGKGGIPGYVDADEISSWNEFKVPDDLPQNWHRTLRSKILCSVTLKSGVMNYSDENFHSLSGRILEARGQADLAAEEFSLHSREAARKSSLSIS